MSEPSMDRLQASMAAIVAKMDEAVAPLSNAIRTMGKMLETAETGEFPNRKARRKAAAHARKAAR